MTNYRLCAFADEAAAPLDGQIRALSRNSINLIELRGIDGENVADITPKKAAEVFRRLSDEGISVWSVGSPAGKSDINAAFGTELDRFRRLIETAHICRAACLRLFSFYGTDGRAEYRDEVLMRLSRFAEEGRGSGVVLCHENEKGIYGDVPERCADIHASVPEIRAVFDPANFIQCGVDTISAWNILEPFVCYGHIKDAVRGGRVVPPGEGDGRLAEYLPRFFEGGRRVLTLEPHLSKFVGLAALESGHESAVGAPRFASQDEAFDYAAAALRRILDKINAREVRA